MQHDTDTVGGKRKRPPDDNLHKNASTDTASASRLGSDAASLDRLLKQARRYPHEVLCVKIGFMASVAVLILSLFLWYDLDSTKVDPEFNIRVGMLAYVACLVIIGVRRHKFYAVLEKIASLSEKRDLNVLVPLLAYYDGSHSFFQRMEQLLASVTEADIGLFSRSQQVSLVRCFEFILRKTNERHEKEKRLSEDARRPRMFRLPMRADTEKHQEESELRFAEGILQVLARVGDKVSVHEIEKIIRKYPNAGSERLSCHKMSEHLSFWRERLNRQETANALLRPSLISDKNMLLHPAESEVAPVRELLRPDMNDRSSPC